MCGDTVRTARSGVHEEVIIGEAHRHTIVGEEAQFIHHQAVAAATHFEIGEHVGVDAVKEFSGVWSLDLDFAEG